MNQNGLGATYVRLSGAGCLCVLGIILAAGLWPFHAPLNRVKWLSSMDGIEFGHHGSAVTSGAFQGGLRTDDVATLEIWLRAASTAKGGTILSFAGSAQPGEPFALRQEGDEVSIRRNNTDPQGISRTALFHVHGVFLEKSPVFVAVVLVTRETSVYVNGTLTTMFPHSRAGNDVTGRMVLANSASANDSWSGEVLRLAIYPRKLAVAQIAADYSNWMNRQNPGQMSEGNATALYSFDEHRGTVAHNRLDPSTDLSIPAHYFVLHPRFLRVPWKEYQPTWDYWQDVGVNIAGFIPFGFCVLGYLGLSHPIKYPGATTIILGLLTSLIIETLQAFLPTRTSGMTDLVTNTLGTAIGVLVARRFMAQMLPHATTTSNVIPPETRGSAPRTVVSKLATSTRG